MEAAVPLYSGSMVKKHSSKVSSGTFYFAVKKELLQIREGFGIVSYHRYEDDALFTKALSALNREFGQRRNMKPMALLSRSRIWSDRTLPDTPCWEL